MYLALLIIGLLFIIGLIVAVVYLSGVVYNKITCGYHKCSRHLIGKVVIVTGGNAGIGYETAKDMAERGARVILACRNEQRGTTARDHIVAETGNRNVHYRHLDLASFKSVRDFAADILKNEERLDVLINNAGMVGTKYELTEDGQLLDMQSNHLSPFLLTNLLLPLLKASAPSRIVNLSSFAHRGAKLDLNNLNMSKETYRGVTSYNNTKLCNILMTAELAQRLQGTGVTTNSCHPGAVVTDMLKNFPIIKYVPLFAKTYLKNVWEGAQTPIYLAVSPEVEGVSGLYYADCSETRPSGKGRDRELAKKLWDISEKIVNLQLRNCEIESNGRVLIC